MFVHPFWFLTLGVLLDQLTKEGARLLGVMRLTSFFTVTRAWNPGVSWGLFPCNTPFRMYLLIGVEIGLLSILYFWYKRCNNFFERIGILLIITGALGNLIDRLIFRAVFDFIDIHWGRWHFPAFNVADIFISMGFLILMKESLWPGHKRSP